MLSSVGKPLLVNINIYMQQSCGSQSFFDIRARRKDMRKDNFTKHTHI